MLEIFFSWGNLKGWKHSKPVLCDESVTCSYLSEQQPHFIILLCTFNLCYLSFHILLLPPCPVIVLSLSPAQQPTCIVAANSSINPSVVCKYMYLLMFCSSSDIFCLLWNFTFTATQTNSKWNQKYIFKKSTNKQQALLSWWPLREQKQEIYNGGSSCGFFCSVVQSSLF